MFDFSGFVSGGWDSVNNVTNTIGRGSPQPPPVLAYPYLLPPAAGSFFPTQQRLTVESDFALPRENQGLSFRPVAADAPSLIETAAMRANEWLGSPYEEQFSIPVKRTESQLLAASVSGESPSLWSRVKGWFTGGDIKTIATTSAIGSVKGAFGKVTPEPDSFDQMLQDIYNFGEQTVGRAAKVATLADYFMSVGQRAGIISPRATTIEVPRAGYPEGENVQHLDWLTSSAASVFETAKQSAAAMLGQLKGLFNLGYSGPEGSQPAFTIQHEIEPSSKTTTGLIIAGVVLVIILLLLRKK